MKKKDILLELSLPVVMAALGIFVLIKAESIKPKSAATFPRICAVLMLVGVAVTILQILVTKKKTTHFEGLRVEKALLLLLMILLYTILLPRIGYIIPTLLLCACIILLLNYRKLPVIGLCSCIAVVVIFVLFKIILKVPLPMLFLDF